MTTKEEALTYVKTLAEKNIITKNELDRAYSSGSIVTADVAPAGIQSILYYIGGAIVFVGIAILVGQNWSALGFATKVLATLGTSVAAYIVGLLFCEDPKTEKAGYAFYLISALVMPVGLYVVFDNFGFDVASYEIQSIISAILFGMYASSYVLFRKNVFALFSIFFGTWLFFSLTGLIAGGIYFDDTFDQYRILAVGASYMLLGYSFSESERAPLTGFLYGFGILGFLGSALALGGWDPNQNIFWELVYPLLVFGALFLSVYVKNKAFLVFGTIFLMGYIFKITSEYFSSGLGWPLVLVITGLAMIGVGYMSISLKNKYLS